jgi:1,4-dihydroxy-2-naphthoyl-CoA hydrolase
MSVLDELNKRGIGTLPGLIGLTIVEAERGRISSRLDLREELMAPNGYLHAGTVVALADTSCGYGTFVSLPEGAEGFTTVELKSNFVGTKRGRVPGEARPRWPHDAGLGRDRLGRGGGWQAHSPLPMHADDPLPALNVLLLAQSGFAPLECDPGDEDDAREDDTEPGHGTQTERLVKEHDAE